MVNRSILDQLDKKDFEAIDLMHFTSEIHKNRPVSDRMQRRVLKMFSTWKNDCVYENLVTLARSWDIHEKTLRYAVTILARDKRLSEWKDRRGRKVRGVNWQTVYDEIEPLTRTGEPTGQLDQNCPEPTGQLGQNCPVQPGTTARTYKDNVQQVTTTSTTTDPLSVEWLALKDELVRWGIKKATKAARMARDDRWTFEAIRELRVMAPKVEPVDWYYCLTNHPERLYGPDEAQRHYLERMEREQQQKADEQRDRQQRIEAIREAIETDGKREGVEPWRIEAKLFREFERLGFSEAITDDHREAQKRFLREGELPKPSPAEPITKLITSDTANIKPLFQSVPRPEPPEKRRAKLLSDIAAMERENVTG